MSNKTGRGYITIIENPDEPDNPIYKLTPKGLFAGALEDAGICDLLDERIDAAWKIFELQMENLGYTEKQEAAK